MLLAALRTTLVGLALAVPLTLFSQTLTGTIVSANMTANTASVVDVATGQLRATYPTGPGPHEVAISNDGRWAVISVYGNRESVGHSLLVLDLTGNSAPRTIEMGQYLRPHGMRFLPGDKRMLVTSEATQKVAVVDFVAGTVDTVIATAQPATHMVVLGPGGKRAFTTNISAKNISVIDVDHYSVARTIDAGACIEGITVDPAGSEVWVGANDEKVVLVFNTTTGDKVAQIDGFGMPYRMAITPDGASAVISDPGAERVFIADVKTHTIRAMLDMATGGNGEHPSPQGVTLSRDGQIAFVTLKALGKVAVIDVGSGRIVKTLDVGGGSDGVGFSPLAAKERAS
jgi:DNA-binding beta-propeller fold protein YncE